MSDFNAPPRTIEDRAAAAQAAMTARERVLAVVNGQRAGRGLRALTVVELDRRDELLRRYDLAPPGPERTAICDELETIDGRGEERARARPMPTDLREFLAGLRAAPCPMPAPTQPDNPRWDW